MGRKPLRRGSPGQARLDGDAPASLLVDGDLNPAASPMFSTMRKQPVALRAVESIKEMIRSGQLSAGQALPPEREFAEALGISRPTLREAIGALTAMNIVEPRHGEGTFVTDLSPARLAEPISFLLKIDDSSLGYLLVIRRALESEAAARAAEVMERGALERLEDLVAQAASKVDDPDDFARLDYALHIAIVRSASNPLLTSLYTTVAQLSARSRRLAATDPEMRRLACEDHERVLRALAKRSPSAARAAMVDHLRRVEASIGNQRADAVR